MTLRFEGDLSLWMAVLLGCAVAGLVIWLYRAELQRRGGRFVWIPPLLRGLAALAIILMLAGPVLRGNVQIGDLSNVLVFVDQSRSMSLTDETMSSDRKLLIAQQLGWLPQSAIDDSPHQAAARLAAVRQLGTRLEQRSSERSTDSDSELQSDSANRDAQLNQTVDELVATIREAHDCLDAESELAHRMETELVLPSQQLRDCSTADAAAIRRTRAVQLVATAAEWESRLRTQFASNAADSADNTLIAAAFDHRSRWQRIESTLVAGSNPVVPELAQRHQVDLLALSQKADASGSSVSFQRIWQSGGTETSPANLEAVPNGPVTDLVTGIQHRTGQASSGRRTAVILFTDGQHNEAGADTTSPMRLAKLLGDRGIPIFAIGVGARQPPPDLAVLAVQAPESVFADDRVKGRILLKDHMPEGLPLELKIEIDHEVVWNESLTTSDSRSRTVEFDFSIKQLVEDRLARAVTADDVVSLPLAMIVRIEPLDNEVRDDNNQQPMHIRAITRPRRALIVDGRPRWETRYLHSMFDRDDHWQVTRVLLEPNDDGDLVLPRGLAPEQFPAEREALLAYDLVILGEVPATAFTSREQEWLSQFVAVRGGGMICIDGQRGKLRTLSGTPLEPLLPVRWIAPHARGLRGDQIIRLSVTERGAATAAFALHGQSDESARCWNQLQPPRWIAPAEALPGCETLVESVVRHGTRPVFVTRRFGAGQVLYAATDESWRWRYEHGGAYHSRFWNQVANHIMEPPYAVHDKFVSIDTGGFTYQQGEAAQLQVRLRNDRGQPITQANASAQLFRDDQLVATVPLSGDPDGGGVFRGKTPPLQPGIYQVGVEAAGVPADRLATRAEFAVLGEPTGEMNVLYCDEERLQQMAQASGGAYLREEDIGRLPGLLEPLSEGRIEQREIALWRSWLWFLPVVGLFTAEWISRKWLGLM